MNPNDFKRDIASRHARAAGDSPGVGRIGRMHESAAGSVRRGRRRSGRPRGVRNQNHVWVSVALGVVALGVLVGAVVLWLVPVSQRANSKSGVLAVAPTAEKTGIRVTSRFPSPSKEQAVTLVEDALANRDPAQVKKFFRMGSATVGEVVAFCAGLENSDGKFSGSQWLSSIDSPQMLLEGVVMNFLAEDYTTRQRLGLLTPNTDGRWQVDFEALARVVKPSWPEVLKLGSGAALVRVTLAPDFYYNGPFQDESKWVSYGMSSPDVEFLIRGYCRKDSPEAEAVKRMFTDGSKAVRAVLEIEHVKGGGERQFQILELRAQDWALPASEAPLSAMESGL